MTHVPPAPIHLPLPWMDEANCRRHDPDLWFPIAAGVTPEREAAINVCGACPVRAECLAYAIETDQRYGIWGGLTSHERGHAAREL